jgi:hypothetical protein
MGSIIGFDREQREGATMKVRHVVLVALAAAVTLTSVAAAGPAAAKQRLAIDAKILPGGTFVLTPLRAGALKRDSGTVNEGKTLSQRNRITTGDLRLAKEARHVSEGYLA